MKIKCFTVISIIYLSSIQLFAQAYQLSDNHLKYQSGNLSLELLYEQNSVRINKLAVGQNRHGLLSDSRDTNALLWIIDLIQPERKIYSSSAKFLGWSVVDSFLDDRFVLKWEYKWQNIELLIVVDLTIPKYASSTYWNMKIFTKNQETFAVQRVVFPILPNIEKVSSNNICLINPRVWGEKYHSAHRKELTSVYPSASMQSQFWALYDEKSFEALYYAAKDTAGYYKLFKTTIDRNNPNNLRVEHWYFPVPVPVVSWGTPYSIEIRPYLGDWYHAAKFYRSWLVSSKIFPHNLQKPRKWIYEVDFWLRAGPENDTNNNFLSPQKISADILRINNYLNGNIAVHLYNWHKHKFDEFYPDYFPPRTGFVNFLQEMQREKIPVVPYVNGRIADSRIVQRVDSLKASVVLPDYDLARNQIKEIWNGKEFNIMCPSARGWQNTLGTISSNLLIKYGVSGIYFDQVCNSKAMKCIDVTHGHLPDSHRIGTNSSGNHWVRGYREIFKKINTIAPPYLQPVFISEDAADAWHRFFDIYLMYNTRSTDFNSSYVMIPLYPTIYSGFALTMGFQDLSVEVDKHLQNHITFLGRSYVWGSQLGWLQPKQILQSQFLLAYVKQLVEKRAEIRRYLHFGEMKRSPKIFNSTEPLKVSEWKVVSGERKFFDYELSSIQTSYWELSSDSAVVLLSNLSNRNFTDNPITLEIDLSDSKLKRGRYKLTNTQQNNELLIIERDTQYIEVTLGAFEVKNIELVWQAPLD
jgi:hypothetical protein